MAWACANCDAESDTKERPKTWCRSCGADGLWVRRTRRRAGEVVAAGARAWTSKDIVGGSWQVRRCGATRVPWASPAVLLLYGRPASGKSTLALQIAAQLRPIVVAAAEEGPGPALARRLVLAGLGTCTNTIILRSFSVDDLVARARQGGAVVVDSVSATTLIAQDLRGLCDAGADMVIAIAQVTKAGLPAGRNALLHEADVAMEVRAGRWTLTKSRFGSPGATGLIRGVAGEVA